MRWIDQNHFDVSSSALSSLTSLNGWSQSTCSDDGELECYLCDFVCGGYTAVFDDLSVLFHDHSCCTKSGGGILKGGRELDVSENWLDFTDGCTAC